MENEKDLKSAMPLRISTSMSFEHLAGHTGGICEKGPACEGGPTCYERIWLKPRTKGDLLGFFELIRKKVLDLGVYGIFWNMGRALLKVLPAPVVRKIGFIHPVLQSTPSWSTSTPLSEKFWRTLLTSGKEPYIIPITKP
jgi:hypothetical protein